MAKVTQQNVPPQLEALFFALTSPGKITQGPDGTLQLKKGKKQPKKKPRRNLDLKAFQETAELVKKINFDDVGKQAPENFVYDLTQDLILGIFPPQFFEKCEVETAITLESIPASIADENPPPYGFRTNEFLPTLPTYPDGTPTSQPASYSGEKIGLKFEDKLWRWRKIIYKCNAIDEIAGEKKVLIRWDARIDIDASARGSKPMLSLNMTASLSTDTGGALSSTAPPIQKKTTYYWRFQMPPSAAPFFHTFQVRKIVKPLARILKKSGSGQFTRYVINCGNRPMMGRAYNNNNTVDTRLTGDPELWEIATCSASNLAVWENLQFTTSRAYLDFAIKESTGLTIAVGRTFAISSTDLIVFVTKSVLLNMQFEQIVYAQKLDKFVMVGRAFEFGAIYITQDGNNYNAVQNPGNVERQAIAWSDELDIFVAFGRPDFPNEAIWSTDGETWHTGSKTNTSTIVEVIWSAEAARFVGVGTVVNGVCGVWSLDGKNWNDSLITPDVGLISVAWSPVLDKFAAVASSAINFVGATSVDGAVWTTAPSGVDQPLRKISWMPKLNKFLAVGRLSAPSDIYSSDNGITWQPRPSGLQNGISRIRWVGKKCTALRLTSEINTPLFAQTKKGG